jgi:hypothetical protein
MAQPAVAAMTTVQLSGQNEAQLASCTGLISTRHKRFVGGPFLYGITPGAGLVTSM